MIAISTGDNKDLYLALGFLAAWYLISRGEKRVIEGKTFF